MGRAVRLPWAQGQRGEKINMLDEKVILCPEQMFNY
jgi:hypothetical protein